VKRSSLLPCCGRSVVVCERVSCADMALETGRDSESREVVEAVASCFAVFVDTTSGRLEYHDQSLKVWLGRQTLGKCLQAFEGTSRELAFLRQYVRGM
jgi:hypothetical protein